MRFVETSRPDKKFNKVVLPLPEGPNIAINVLGINLPYKLFRIRF